VERAGARRGGVGGDCGSGSGERNDNNNARSNSSGNDGNGDSDDNTGSSGKETNTNSGRCGSSSFLHCVDCRDLGCEHACVDDALHEEWMSLLQPKEKEALQRKSGAGGPTDGASAAHTHHKDGRCLPDWNASPEEDELDRLRSNGMLLLQNDKMEDEKDDDQNVEMEIEDDDGNNSTSSMELITFPSMESFFGQCTDILYYTPNFKVAYAPFLAKCVQSFDTWNAFFVKLFLGGRVDAALSMLNLSMSQYMHVRSPIMKCWNATHGEYEWHERENEEEDLTLSLLPVKCFLKARGSIPPRTWSSNIFASLAEKCHSRELRELADDARKWALEDIAKHCDNPKMSDDEIGGGEWFLAYLRQCHRDIYDDIDRTDPTILLRKNYVPGDSGRKHKIGDIAVPSCQEGFRFIQSSFNEKKSSEEEEDQLRQQQPPTMNKEAEVMAKILIDIYMSKLVDASTIGKIAQILSTELEEEEEQTQRTTTTTARKNVVIVCYMGSVHTRALAEFFTSPKYNFTKKIFCGTQDWDEEEGRVMHLPPELWNLRMLF